MKQTIRQFTRIFSRYRFDETEKSFRVLYTRTIIFVRSSVKKKINLTEATGFVLDLSTVFK